MKKITLSLTMLLTFIMLNACGGGGGGGGGNDNPPEPQEEQTGDDTNDNTSDNDNEPTSCLTETQRENIRSFMNGLVNRGQIEGATFLADETFLDESFTITRVSESSWQLNGGACEIDVITGEATECETSQADIEFRDGCFYWGDEQRARLRSTSSSRLSFTSEGTSQVWTISGTNVTYRLGNGRRFESY